MKKADFLFLLLLFGFLTFLFYLGWASEPRPRTKYKSQFEQNVDFLNEMYEKNNQFKKNYDKSLH